MSLFWLRQESPQEKKPAPRRREPAVAFDLGSLSCSKCTLDKEPLQHPKMQATGSIKPIFYVLGEAPGKQEDELGEQFVGKSGALIRDRLPDKWLKHIRWNNSVNCRPPGNRDPSSLELACCRSRVDDDIARTKPKVILAFGAIAMQWLTQAQHYHPFAGGRQRAEALAHGEMPAITFWRGKRIPVNIKGHVCWAYLFGHPAWLLRSMNDKRLGAAHLACFERDLATAFYEYERGLPEPYVEPPEDFKKNIEVCTEFGPKGIARIAERLGEIAKRPDFSIDLETNAKRPFFTPNPKLLSVAVGNYHDTFAFGIDHPECQWTKDERDLLLAMLYSFLLKSGRKWAHYLNFELEWLRFLLDEKPLYESEWGDTNSQAHAIDERPGKELEDLTTLYFGFDVKAVMNLDASRLEEYPLLEVLVYNGLDVKYCDGVRVAQSEALARLGLEHVYQNLVRLSPSLVRMTATGMVRDVPQIVLLSNQLEHAEHGFVRKILEHKDVERFKLRHGKFNPASNPDMLAFFQSLGFKLKNVDEEALLQVDHPVARLELKRRGERKLRSTYLVPLLDGGKAVAVDGRYHPTYRHTTTVTTRLASEAHNFPRRERKEIRRAIKAPPEHKFVSCDYGQIEARVVAMCSKDPTLIKETWNGDDIHGVWTEKLGARFIPKKLKEPGGFKWIRDGVKNLWTFPQFFRSTLYSVSQDLSARFEVEISERALQPFNDEFWGKYAGVLRWQDELIAFYWEHGYVETLTGWRRHEPMNENEIVNLPVQGTAAQIALDAQYRIDRLAYKQGLPHRSPMFQGHDDLSFYIPDSSLEEDIEWIAREMCLCKFPFINVPLAVEVSFGDNWCDKTELHTFRSTDFQ